MMKVARNLNFLLRACLVIFGLVGSYSTFAAEPSSASDIERCNQFSNEDFSNIVEAPSQVISAKWEDATSSRIAHCAVEGYASASIGLRMVLPAPHAWNGKFLMYGCGGFCGVAWINRCEAYLNRGYACIASDMGHISTTTDGKWAYNNRSAEIDFGFRSTHLTAVAGKAIAKRFYSKAHDRSYFFGCSTGGRQGVISAQAFPHDFDGIIAGAPVINETQAALRLLWSFLANHDADGNTILKAERLPALHKAVVNKCDANDGLIDGLISAPGSCKVNPEEFVCTSKNKGKFCLSKGEADVVRKIYQGPVSEAGKPLNVGGPLPGSELTWTGYIGTRDDPSLYGKFMIDYFRYAASDNDPGPGWLAQNFKFSDNIDEFGIMERLYNASNPDLRRFNNRGGKMIMFHGLHDQTVVPATSIDFYEMTTRAMGGKSVTDDFFRLFLVPAMNHCVGGPGPTQIDYMTALENWVERGVAPERLIGTGVSEGKTEYIRPIWPYPKMAKYDGSGDQASVDSFHAVDQPFWVGPER